MAALPTCQYRKQPVKNLGYRCGSVWVFQSKGYATLEECKACLVADKPNNQLPTEKQRRFVSPPIYAAGRLGGPGTELKKLLSKLRLFSVGGCGCDNHAAEMDRRGPGWCRSNMELIVDWLEEEAEKRKLLAFTRTLAKGLVWCAIRRAEKLAAKQRTI